MTHASAATKRCSRCGAEKPLPDFRPDPRGLNGRRSQCKKCENAAERDRRRKSPRRAAKPTAPGLRERRPYRLQYYYGITEAQYAAVLAGQGGRCFVCQEDQPADALHIDHDHECCPGRRSCGACVRGLLCQECNQALGKLRDDPQRLLRAIAYLVAPPAPAILTARRHP